MSEKIVFTPNLPVQVALKYPDGKEVEGRFGNQMYYSLCDGRSMYLNMDVAAKINLLGPRKGEPFLICQRWTGKKGDQRQWDVWRPNDGESKPVSVAEMDIENQLRESIRRIDAKRDPVALLGPDPPDHRASVSAGTPTPASPIAEATNGHSNRTNGHSHGSGTLPAPKTKLEDALKTVVAACHAAREYAKQIGYEAMPPFTSEDIRTMANTLMIQNGGGSWPRQ